MRVFVWKDIDNGTVSLWSVSEDKFLDPWTLPPDTIASTSYTVTVRDENYKIKSTHIFPENEALRTIAVYLTEQKLRSGKDSIQITHSASAYHVRVEGKVEDLEGINFQKFSKWKIDNYSFFPRENGLRASYIHQERVDNYLYEIMGYVNGSDVNSFDLNKR